MSRPPTCACLKPSCQSIGSNTQLTDLDRRNLRRLGIMDGLILSVDLGACIFPLEGDLLLDSLSRNACKSSFSMQHVHQEESLRMCRGAWVHALKVTTILSVLLQRNAEHVVAVQLISHDEDCQKVQRTSRLMLVRHLIKTPVKDIVCL